MSIEPTITNFSVLAKVFDDDPFTITDPSSNSTGAFTYTSSNLSVATVTENVITIVGVGSSIITADQATTTGFTTGTITATFVVSQATPILTNFSVSAKTFLDASFTIIDPSSNSTGLITYSSDDLSVATVDGNVITIIGSGTSIITAGQASTTNFLTGTITSTFVVNPATPTITNFSVSAKTFLDDPFTITDPSSNSTGLITYTSSNLSVATVTENVITIVGVGSSIITADQSSTANFTTGTITSTFVVSQATPTITNFSVPTKTILDDPFTITDPSSNSTGLITYTSSNTAVATIDENVITIVGVGSSIITADQATTTNFTTGTITSTLVVSLVLPVLTNFSVPTKTFLDASFTIIDPSSNSMGAFTYTSSNTAVATIDGNVVTIIGAGNSIITADQATTTDYATGTITTTLVVNPATPVLTNFSVSAKTFLDASFSITDPSSNSTGAFTYTSSNTDVATIDGNVVTIVGVGSSIITATQASTANYTTETITATFVVSQATPTITNFSVAAKTFLDAPFTITDPSSNSTGAFTYTSSNTAVATIVGTTVTIVGSGSSTITADQASTTNFSSGTITATFVVSEATPMITNFSVSAKTLGDAPFTITDPASNSAGAFTYTSSNADVATIAGTTVTIVGIGSSTITASQASTTNFSSGTITTSFVVSQAPTITNFSVSAKTVGNAPFTITAPTSNSAGAFTYTSSNADVATISGTTVTIVGGGSATITATQASNASYETGTITATFVVNPATLVLTNFSVPAKAFGDDPFTITAPTTNSTGLITYTSSNTAVTTIAGTTVTIVGVGSSTITASQASTASYTSGTITTSLVVSKGTPTITNFLVPAKTVVDAPFTITAPTSNSTGAFTYTSSSLSSANLYVAVGIGNTIATSTDGITWTGRGATVLNYGYGVAYGNGLWVAVGGIYSGTGNLIATSTDGITWTGRGSSFFASTNSYGYGVAYGNGLWVAVGESGGGNTIATSTDGITWTGRGISLTTKGRGVAYANGLWVACCYYGYGNSIATSTDGITWTGRGKTVFTFSGFGVAYGNGLWVAVGQGGNTIATSTDGITWTGRGTTVFTTEGRGVAYANGLWVAVGNGTNTIATSTNGTTWTGRGKTVLTNFGYGVTYLNDLWVAVGEGGNSIATSTDGINWTGRGSIHSYGYGVASNYVPVATIEGNVVTINGLGTATITANQATTTNFLSGTITASLVVNKATTVLTGFTVPAKTFGNAPFTITPPTSNSTGAFTYTSSNTAVATVSGTTITIVGAGSSTITASQASTASYTSGTITASLVVSQATPTITYSIPAKTFGTAPFTINAPSSNSAGAFTYTSSNTAVATISGTTVTIIGAGSSNITATQASTTNYLTTTITAALVVNPATPVLTSFTVPAKAFGDASFSLTDPSSNSTGLITYAIGLYVAVGQGTNSIVTSMNGITWTGRSATVFTDSGKSVCYAKELWIAVGQGGNSIATSPDGITWTGRGKTALSGYGIGVAYGNGVSVAVGSGANTIATSTDGITWTGRTGTTVFNSVGWSVAYGAGLWVAVGSTTSSIGNGNTIATSTDAVTWTGRYNYIFYNNAYGVAYGKDGSGNGLWVAVGYGGSDKIASSTDGINWTGRGSTVFTSSSYGAYGVAYGKDGSGNGLWVAVGYGGTYGNSIATSVNGITWTGRGQTVFTTGYSVNYTNGLWFATGQGGNSIATSVDGITWTGQPANGDLTTGYGVASNFASAIATIAGNVVTIVGGGSSIIIAEQAGTANYTSGTITASFLVNRTTPVLTNFTIPAKTVGDISFSITAPTTNSAGAFTYTSSNTSVATVAGTTVTIIGVGTATITATQASTTNYITGTITTSLVVTQGTLVLSNFSIPAKTFGIAPFTITAPTSNSTGAFTYTSDNTAVATVTGNIVTIVGTGSSTFTATQASTANYTSATIDASLVVNPATPTITFSIPVKTVVNDPFIITDPSSNSTGAFTYTSSNTGVATVDGNVITIVAAGSSTITASQASTANYTVGTITASLTVNLVTTTLTNFTAPAKTFGDASFNITDPTTNSNGAFTYTSSNTAVATVAGTTVTIVGGGSSTITAVQASTAIYASATITSSLVVSKATTVLTDFSVPAKTFGNAPFTITAPTTNGNGAFTYTSSNTAVATVSGTTITIVGGGSSTITANQATTTNYLAGTITSSLVVSQATPTITYSIPAKVFGIAPYTITAPTSNSAGAFTYTSSDSSVATIAGTTVTIIGTGSSTITANQASTTNYVSTTITAALVVNSATPTITGFTVSAKTFLDASFTITPPTSNSTGLITYTSSNLAVATVDGNVVTIIVAGSSTITASQASTANYLAGTITASFVVNKATPTITSFSVPANTFGNAPFTITDPSSNSAGAFTYTSSNTAVATVSGTTVTIVGGGSSTITATQATTANYLAGTITASLVISQTSSTITNFSVPAKTFGNAPFTITPPTSNSAGAFTYTSSNTAVATVAGTTVTIVGAGSSTITANQASTNNYFSGTITSSLVVSQATPTITFSVLTKTFGTAPFTITPPTSNSTGAFTYASSNTDVATVSGNVITIIGEGSSTITANQASTTNYVSGTITASFVVSPAPSVLTNFSVSAKTFLDASFTIIDPSSNSTGVFTYTSSNTAVATVSGNVVTIIGGGSSTITATQASTTNYASGTITASFVVNKATPTISNFSAPAKVFGNAPFTITAPTTNSAGAFTYTSSLTAVATVSGTTVTIVGGGSSTITATQATTTNYLAGTITSSLVVSQATPTITGFTVSAKTFGNAPFTITAPTTNSSGAFTYTSSDSSVATIAGNVLTIVGGGSSTITATQASTTNYISGTITASFVVNPATPTITGFTVSAKTFLDAPFTITAPTTNSTGLITYASSNTAVATVTGTTVTIIGGGSSTITASQASTTNYLAGTITASFVVNKATPTITSFSVPAKTVGDPLTLTAPSSNSTGAFTYTSSNTAVATISGTTVTIIGVGSSTITATQATSTNYLAGTITGSLVVSKGTPILTNFSIPVKTNKNTPFTITAPTSTSTGAFTYTSSDSSVATIVGNTITIVGNGSSTITANQATTTNYLSGTITAIFQVNQATPVLTSFSIPDKLFGIAPFAITDPSSNSTGAFTYTSSNTSVVTVSGNTITLIGIGSSTITAVQAETSSYTPGTITTTILVSQGTPTITFSIPTKTFGNAPFTIAPTSNSTGAFTYTSSNTAVVTIVGNVITIIGEGSSTISAEQASTVNFLSGTITASLVVNPATPTITNFSVANKTFLDDPFTITDPSSNSTGLITYTSSNTAVATVDGNVVTIVGTGSSTISAEQASIANYTSRTITATLVVSKAMPTITFSVSAKTFLDAPFTITDTSSNSTGLITYTSSNTSVATIAGNVVTIVGGGSSTITASQATTANFSSGTITATLVVSKAIPTITNLSISAKTFGNAPFSITDPSSNSMGLITYTSSNTTVATISGNVVTIVGGGSSTITATQASTTNYLTETITTSLVVSPTTTVLTNFSVPAKIYLDAPFSITTPTTNSNGLFTYTSSNTSVATVSGNVLTIVGAGSSTITANQVSTASYISATITASLVVTKATPTITFSIPTKVIGVAPFIPAPITNSTGAFTYTSSNLTVATVTGNTITILKIGTSTITAVQASTTNYISSGIITTTLLVTLPTPTIIFSIPEKLVGIAPFAITITSNSNSVFTYTSSELSVATVLGNKITIVGAGSSIITAVQPGTATYLSGTSTTTLIVNLPIPTLTKFSIPVKTFGNAPFAIIKPTSNNTSNFTYTSYNLSVATISGDMVTIVGGGSSTITASQPETIKFKAGTITTTIVVSQAKPVLTFSIPAKIVGNAPFTITDPSSNSTGAFTYTSATTSVVTVDGNVVTIVGNGSSIITAVQASSTNYLSGTITAPLVVRLPAPTITDFSVPTKVFGTAAFAITAPTSNSIGLFTYTSSKLTVAKITGNVVTIIGVGTAIITAVQAGSANYVSGTITTSFVVSQATPTIFGFSILNKTVGNALFAITAPKSNNTSVFTYTSSNTDVATIDVNKITIVGAGSSIITANQISTPNYTAGSITATFVAILPTPKIAKLAIPTKIFGTAPFTITDPTSNSTGAFSYTSSNLSVVTIEGNVVTIVGRGSSFITAVQAGTDNYLSGTIATILVINPATPTITNFSIPAKIFGNAPFTITDPTTNSSGTFTYTSAKLNVATVAGNVVTIVGIGSSVITATQAIGANHISGKITATVVSNPPAPTIANLTIPAKTFGNAPFALTAPTSNSAGAFTYTSSNTSVATVTKNIVTIIGIGSSTITATQAGTATYASGTITASLVVSQGTPTITKFTIPVKIIGNAPFSITPPTSNSTGLFTYTSSNTAVATVEGNVITIIGTGSSTITAEQASTTNYISGTITATLVVNLLTPTITGFIVPAKTFGNAPFSIIDPSSNSAGAFTYTSSNTAVATVSGNVVTIVGGGSSIITAVQATTSSYASGTITAIFKVNPGTPTITNFSILNNTVGSAPFTITPPTSNSAGAFTYISSKLTVATISGNVVTIVGAGSSTITANQVPTSNYITGKITTIFVVGL